MNDTDKAPESEQKDEKKPNERLGFELSSSVKIFDPETNKVFVQMRAD